MDEPRVRAATAADLSAIAETVDQTFRHYVDRMGKPMLDDYVARVLEGVVRVLEDTIQRNRVERVELLRRLEAAARCGALFAGDEGASWGEA